MRVGVALVNRDCLPVTADCILELSLPAQGIAKIELRLGMIRFKRKRLARAGFRFLRLPGIKISDGEVLKRGKMSRLHLQRAPVTVDGLGQFVEFRKGVAEIVDRVEIVRLLFQRPAVIINRFLHLSQSGTDVAEIDIRGGVIGFELNRSMERLGRRLEPVGRRQGSAETQMRLGMFGHKPDRFAQGGDGVVQAPVCRKRDAEIVMRLGVIRPQTHGRAQTLLRFHKVMEHAVDNPEQAPRPGVIFRVRRLFAQRLRLLKTVGAHQIERAFLAGTRDGRSHSGG